MSVLNGYFKDSNILNFFYCFINICFVQQHAYGSYRSLKCLHVLEIHHCFFKTLKSLNYSTFSFVSIFQHGDGYHHSIHIYTFM